MHKRYKVRILEIWKMTMKLHAIFADDEIIEETSKPA